MGTNMQGEDIVWVDYDAAVSMHRVRATVKSERRLERLASRTSADNRISFGCINLPVAFYEKALKPAVQNTGAIVYVLPEQSTAHEVFGSYDVTGTTQLAQRPAASKVKVAHRKANSNTAVHQDRTPRVSVTPRVSARPS